MQTVSLWRPKRFKVKKSALLEVFSGLFILLFVYTAISKFFDISRFTFAIEKIPFVIQSHIPAKLFAWSIPIIELIISALLFIKPTRLIGFIASFFIMLFFTFHIGYMLLKMDTLPCNCGGVIGQLSWKEHLVFNIAWTILAAIAWGMEHKSRKLNNE